MLTCNIHFKYLASYISKSVVSCTAVCPGGSSANVRKIPSWTLVQYFTITTILQDSVPGDVWYWFTSCFAKQNHV